MSATCSAFEVEVLSAFLDQELDTEEARDVEAHLETCDHCRARLDGLGRVSSSLRSLERLAPPPILDELVLGRLEVPAARSWSQRLDDLAAQGQRTRATIGPMFALVMMLVLLVFLFGEAMERRDNQPQVISLPSQPKLPLTETSSGQRFVEVQGAPWAEVIQSVNASSVFVEESVSEHFALSHGPGPAAELVLVGELPVCGAANSDDAQQLSELKRASGADESRTVVVVTRSGSELRCIVL